MLKAPSTMPHLYQEKYYENIFIEYPKMFQLAKKAKKWLEENNVEFVDRHIIEETIILTEELTEWIKPKQSRKWFNTSGLKIKH